jgi:multicomponent Na+:H+ antiporter subunit D
MNVAAVGTAISFAKLIFIPRGGQKAQTKPGFWPAVLLLLGGLIVTNAVYFEAYTVANLLKAIATIGVGWLVYFVVVRRTVLKLPRLLEQFEHLVGFMSLISILIFWMALG